MYKNIIQIENQDVKSLNINPKLYYSWADYVINHPNEFILPTKIRMPIQESDYFNVMPCFMSNSQFGGVKIVTRSENRRKISNVNIDSDIFLYDKSNLSMKAIIDGSYITTIRTAAVAVHSVLNFATRRDIIAMIGLGNIGTSIGEILFAVEESRRYKVKLFKYKDHAEKFIEKFKEYDNIEFEICSSYEDLVRDSDVILSSVTYIENDFCPALNYKPGCTVIPVHLRGFMECDLAFDHIITSDLESIKKFKYYDRYKKLSYVVDVLNGNIKLRKSDEDRVIIYNLGLASFDIYFANKIYQLITE